MSLPAVEIEGKQYRIKAGGIQVGGYFNPGKFVFFDWQAQPAKYLPPL